MAVYKFVLKNDAGEARHVSVAADSEAEAEQVIAAQEQKKVAFVLGDAAELAALEKRLKEGTLSGRDKGQLFSHMQDKPYTIQKAKGGSE
jgi:hypothetical protein